MDGAIVDVECIDVIWEVEVEGEVGGEDVKMRRDERGALLRSSTFASIS
jgi:hypothetical protein